MNNIRKIYIQRCVETVSAYGFLRKGATFIRAVHDVVQTFTYEKLSSGRECRVLFSVLPLCLRIEKGYMDGFAYSHELRKFEVQQNNEGGDRWKYDPKSEDSIDSCVEEIIRYIKKYLLPFFEKANNSHTAFRELIQVEERFDANRKRGLKLSGIMDRAKPIEERILLDTVIYYLALKNDDYAFALQCRQALEQQNQNAFENMLAHGYLDEKEKCSREKSIAILQEECRRLAAGDTAYFKQILIENEAYSNRVLHEVLKVG